MIIIIIFVVLPSAWPPSVCAALLRALDDGARYRAVRDTRGNAVRSRATTVRVCVCVRACVCACVCAHARASVCVLFVFLFACVCVSVFFSCV
jgi:hypothetical protein